MALAAHLTRALGACHGQCAAFRQSVRGAIAVEFALLSPVALLLMLGVVEVASALSGSLSVQTSARAGAHYGLTKPPLQGDMKPIIDAVKAAMPGHWVTPDAVDPPTISASLICECEVTGPIACGLPCAKDEQSLTYLKVDVAKVYTPIVTFRYFSPTFEFKNSSQVRLK